MTPNSATSTADSFPIVTSIVTLVGDVTQAITARLPTIVVRPPPPPPLFRPAANRHERRAAEARARRRNRFLGTR